MSSYSQDIEGAYFPDGNATIPRLLVRKLIPGVAPGKSMEDVTNARFDYSRLDAPESKVRIRLSSTAVHVDPLAGAEAGVAVTYVRGGNAYRIRARECVLAGYNEMIPHLCPQLPEAQKTALRYAVKTPLVSTNVLLKNGKALQGWAPPASTRQPVSTPWSSDSVEASVI